MTNQLLTTNISLDTSIFVEQNFLASKKMHEISELCKKGVIEIFLTDITYNEVISRFKANMLKTENDIKKPIKNLQDNAMLLRNFHEHDVYFNLPKIDSETLILRFKIDFDNWLKNNKATIISTGHIKIKEVFEDYFNNNPPFKEGKKKHEFPDAFTLKALEEYFSKKNSKTYLLSSDKDLLIFKSKIIIPFENVAEMINMIIRATKEILEKKAIKLIEKGYTGSKPFLEIETKKRIVSAIENEIESIHEIDYMQVEYAELTKISKIEFDEFSIVSLSVSDNSAKLECEVSIDIEVLFVVEDISEAYYDREDDLNFGVISRKFTSNGTIDLIVSISAIIDLDEKVTEFEVEEINNGENFDIIGTFGL